MRRRRLFGAPIGALTLFGLTACVFPHNPQPPEYPKCIRGPLVPDQATGKVPIAKELTKIYAACAKKLPKCDQTPRHHWGFFETVVMRGSTYPAPTWVWSGPPYGSFSVSDQDGILLQALGQADYLRPANKQLISLTFFEEQLGGPVTTTLYVGAKATFGVCTTALPG